MRLLIDAHLLIWALDDPIKLAAGAVTALQNPANELLIGAGTIRELSIKIGFGKLTLSLSFRRWMDKAMADLGLIVLAITLDHAARQAELPDHNRVR
jgi:PIN domain nuclease of toxin-antitoxin system